VAKVHFTMEGPPGQKIVKFGAEPLDGGGLIVTVAGGLVG
jgi:hypothetical protein